MGKAAFDVHKLLNEARGQLLVLQVGQGQLRVVVHGRHENPEDVLLKVDRHVAGVCHP